MTDSRRTTHPLIPGLLLGLAAAWLALPATASETTVYKCLQPDGSVVFSDQPCEGEMEIQVIDAPAAGTGGEAAREGIARLAREYDERKEAERLAAEKRAAEAAPPVVINVPESADSSHYYPYYRGSLYDRYREPGGGLRIDEDGFSFWYGDRPPHYRPRPPRRPDDTRDPYSATGEPIKEPGYSGRYPGGFPGYR
ncbi:DUF4124 domain-containing protein [Guyparkeria sp.]|uniref:DUF4124 domain-containing protein n=1 Tax=Guyparkeria sp. TaxID=2035736 RepID=UPI0039707554